MARDDPVADGLVDQRFLDRSTDNLGDGLLVVFGDDCERPKDDRASVGIAERAPEPPGAAIDQ